MSERAQLLLKLADDELIVGWRESEWTGVAPALEEDVAFSSIAQNEIGHARAAYELAAQELGTDADALAFDRSPEEYRLRPARRAAADGVGAGDRAPLALRVGGRSAPRALAASDDPEVAGLARKIEREETYHRMHAEMWHERLRDEPRYREALERLWPYALGVVEPEQRAELARRAGMAEVEAVERGAHPELAELWEEMTMVRRSAPAGAQW